MEDILSKVSAKGKFLKLLEDTLKEVDNVGGGASADNVPVDPNAIGNTVAAAGQKLKTANKDYDQELRAALTQHPEFADASKDPSKLQTLMQRILTPPTV